MLDNVETYLKMFWTILNNFLSIFEQFGNHLWTIV